MSHSPAYLGPLHDRRELGLAVGLSAVAGLVGAAGLLYSAGFAVTFMTGNTERAVNGAHVGGGALSAALLIVCFLSGVIVASVARARHWQRAKLGVVLLSLGSNALAVVLDHAAPGEVEFALGSVAALAFGLGALNTAFTRSGETSMPLSYVTGTLVKIGQGVAAHLIGRRPWAWVSHALCYAGFVIGALVGGLVFAVISAEVVLDVLVAVNLIAVIAVWKFDRPEYNEWRKLTPEPAREPERKHTVESGQRRAAPTPEPAR